MARPPIPIVYGNEPWKSSRIRRRLANGMDCGVKSPFKLSIKVPGGNLDETLDTEFYPLHNIPGAKVALKFYLNKKGYARIAVRIDEPQKKYERMGVKATVKLPSSPNDDDSIGTHFYSRMMSSNAVSELKTDDGDSIGIHYYSRRKAQFKKNDYFNFGTNIMESKKFIEDYGAEGVEIKVEGYAFYWDEKLLKEREDWRFGPGYIGFLLEGERPANEERQLEFVARDGTIVRGIMRVLAARNPYFNALVKSSGGDRIQIIAPYHRDVIEIAIKLCYNCRALEYQNISLAQKLELLLFLDQYPISNYKEQLEDHLLEHINYATVGNIARYSIKGHSEALRKTCLDFIRKCIRTNKFFLGYDYNDVREMMVKGVEMETWHEWTPDFELPQEDD